MLSRDFFLEVGVEKGGVKNYLSRIENGCTSYLSVSFMVSVEL